MKSITIQELVQAIKHQAVVVDVREQDEYAKGHVPTAKNIPLSELEKRFNEIGEGDYIICQSGKRSERACNFLEKKGLEVTNVLGGTAAWSGALEK